MLEVVVCHSETISCLKLSGELDISVVEKFRSNIESIPESTTEVCFDFSGVGFIDSTGVGCLVQAVNQLREQDITVMIKRIPKEIYEVFDILGIPELMGEEYLECQTDT